MRPARSLDNVPTRIQRRETAIGVRLQNAAKAAQVRLRMLALAVRRIAIPHRRWIATRPGSIIPHIGPQASGFGFAPPRIEHGHRCVVGVQLLRRTYIAAERCYQRFEQPRCAGDPFSKRRAIEIHAGTPADSLLPLQRTVVAVLGYDHLRAQSWGRKAAIDGASW